MNTPWGKSDYITRIERGLSWVGTPSHGGFMVADGYARKHLSSAALLRGQRFGNYYAFEEDCDFAIVVWEIGGFDIPSQWPTNERELPGLGKFTREQLLQGLSTWHADYLLARGVQPVEPQYTWFQENRKADALRASKSPDLIVSATGTVTKWVPEGYVGVITADGSHWLVPDNQYTAAPVLNLLSNYTGVKAVL